MEAARVLSFTEDLRLGVDMYGFELQVLSLRASVADCWIFILGVN